MANPIRLLSLRNSELLQFFHDIVARCNRFDVTALLLLPKVTALIDEITRLEVVYNKDSGSDVTDLLADLDSQRDNAITGIKLTCEGLSYNTKGPALEAQLIFESIDRYGPSIAKRNYQAETSVINAILADWENVSELTSALSALNLSQWAAELKTLNTTFSDTYQDRVDDILASASDSFTELKVEAIETYKELCDNIGAHSILSENKDYQKLGDAINVIIEGYKELLSKRENGNAADDEDKKSKDDEDKREKEDDGGKGKEDE